MSSHVPLELTHQRVGPTEHLWALRLRYRPGIMGEVIAHEECWGDGPRDWDWSVHPIGAEVAA